MGAARGDVICLSTQSWNDSLWTNKHHIMWRLAERGSRVLYVEPPADRPVIEGPRFHRRRLEKMRRLEKVRDDLWVCQPARWVERPAAALGKLDGLLLARVARSLGLVDPLLWVYHPLLAPALGAFRRATVLYDCVDDYASFPAFEPVRDTVGRLEKALLRRADLVTTSSTTLFERKRRFNPNTHLVENVADFEHFRRAASVEPAEEIAGLPGPRIGFVGNLAEFKIDTELVVGCARRRPDWSFVFVGPEDGSPSISDQWADRQNVQLLGQRAYTELPSLLAACDVLWIPYRVTEHTSACLPLKFFEYLATGKPVAVTPLPSLSAYRKEVRLGNDVESMIEAIRAALDGDSAQARDRRIEVARGHTWEHRIDAILSLLAPFWPARRREARFQRPWPGSSVGRARD